jgi:hypothetical protein
MPLKASSSKVAADVLEFVEVVADAEEAEGRLDAEAHVDHVDAPGSRHLHASDNLPVGEVALEQPRGRDGPTRTGDPGAIVVRGDGQRGHPLAVPRRPAGRVRAACGLPLRAEVPLQHRRTELRWPAG